MIDPDSSAYIIFLILLLVVHAVFAAVKEAVISVRKARLLQLVEERHPAALLIERLNRDATLLLTTGRLTLKVIEWFIIVLSIFAFSSLLTRIIPIESNLIVAIVITAVAMLVTLIIGELIPREIGRNYAEFIGLRLIGLITLGSYLAIPLAHFISGIGRLFGGRNTDVDDQNGDAITEDDLRTYVDASEEDVLNEDEKEMIHSIFNLDDTVAREVMVPRIDMAAVEANASVMEALDLILEAGHSRLPVYTDSVDNVVGILYAKDLLAHLRDGDRSQIVYGLEREAHFVPETKSLSELLRELQIEKLQIAIVVDEYGGVAGLVTIEDIVEEIVGEIHDEYDQEEFFMEEISEDEIIFSARTDLDDINRIMDLDIPTDEIDTLGGLVYTTFGGVPEVGDRITVDNLSLTVLSIDGHRIMRVKIKRSRDVGDSFNEETSHENKTNGSKLVRNASTILPGSS